MKRSILFGRYLVAILFAVVIVQMGCKRETGYYNTSSVVSGTSLNTYEYLKSKPGVYDSLLFLINKFGMQKYLTDSTVTLFAPSNASFQLAIANLNTARKSQGKNAVYLNDLSAGGKGLVAGSLVKDKAIADSAHLDTMVSRYIIRKQYLSSDFAVGDGQTIYSVRGGYPMHGLRVFGDAEGFQGGGVEVIEFANTKRSLFVTRWSKTTTTSVNIKTKNGYIDLLRPDHVFGFDEFISRLTLVPPPPVIFDYKNDVLFPKWTDGSVTDGQVSAGETFKKCLDGSVLTKFICPQSLTNFVYMYWIPKKVDKITGVVSDDPRVCNAYTMTSANDSKLYKGRDPKAFRLEGLTDAPNPAIVPPATVPSTDPWVITPKSSINDGVWVTLDTRQDQDWTTNYQQKLYEFANTKAYRAYRLIILQKGTTTEAYFQISEWTMNYRKLQ